MRLCSIASGSSGNCIYVGSKNTHLLVDTGISKKRIIERLNKLDIDACDLDGILITHEHIDHIKGLGVMNRAFNIPMYCTNDTFKAMKNVKSIGEIDFSNFHIIDANDDFLIGDINVQSIATSHDSSDSCIYRFNHCNNSVAVVTDLGTYDEKIINKLKNLNAMLLEANHDIKMLEVGPYPYMLKQRVASDKGHLSNEQAGEFLNKIINPNLERIYLGHLSKDNNFPELALETVKCEITYDDSHEFKGEEINIKVAERETISECFEV